MTYDLRHERWIPWRRRSGTVEWGPPWLLTDGIAGDDPIVALVATSPPPSGELAPMRVVRLPAVGHNLMRYRPDDVAGAIVGV